MKTAIHFGAGNIGRGFIGGLLSLSGYNVVFADINSIIINKLNSSKMYNIEIVDENTEVQTITNVSGVHIEDESLINTAIEADIITTAVGPAAIPQIAASVSKCIRMRREKGITSSLNIIACENMFGASDALQNAAFRYMSKEEKEYCSKFVGFPNSVVDRIVPPGQPGNDDILTVRVEPFFEWIVDKSGFKGKVPDIEGMITTDNLVAYVERKLLTLNTGHAITAYLGKVMGYETIRNSISDNNIFQCVNSAMEESGSALVRKYNFDITAHSKYIKKIIKRFKNPYLDDIVDRVGREPIRKLSKTDRLVKPIIMAGSYGIDPKNLIIGTAAAFHFYNISDRQSVDLQAMIESNGIKKTVPIITGLDDCSKTVERIIEAYYCIKGRQIFTGSYISK